MSKLTSWGVLWRALVAFSVVLGIGTGLLSLRPGLCDNFGLACNADASASSTPTIATASERERICERLLNEQGLGCTSADFFTAARAGNTEALELYVKAGLDGVTSVTAEGYGSPSGPAWQYLAKENPESLRFLLSKMQHVPGRLDKLRASVKSASFNNCGSSSGPGVAEVGREIDCSSIYLVLLAMSGKSDRFCIAQEFDLDKTDFIKKLEANSDVTLKQKYKFATNQSSCTQDCSSAVDHPKWPHSNTFSAACENDQVYFSDWSVEAMLSGERREPESLREYCGKLVAEFKATYPNYSDYEAAYGGSLDTDRALAEIRHGWASCD